MGGGKLLGEQEKLRRCSRNTPLRDGRMAELTVEEMLMRSDEFGVRLEMVNGIGIWEAMPSPRHQRAWFRIEINLECGCVCTV